MMAYLTLYRKYRPQTFDELIGQPHVARALRNAVREERIAHAYLFAGPRGTGKTTTARLLAKALNCDKGPASEPCGECDSCRRIAQGSALDVIEIDAASKTSVDDIRELRERVQTAPAAARYKVYIVDEVHMLSTSAFNAFLKTLEEPPSHVIFVLCTTEPHKLPATVLSRCQRYDFRRLPTSDLRSLVGKVAQAENVALDEQATTMLVRAAAGSARDALSLLEQAISYAGNEVSAADIQAIVGGVDLELVADFADAVAQRDVEKAFHLVARAVDEGRDLRQLAAELMAHFRDLLLLRVCRRGGELVVLPEDNAERIKAQADGMDERDITRAAQIMSDAERELRRSEQQRLTLELALVRLASSPEPAAAVEEARPAAAAPAPEKQPAKAASAKPPRTKATGPAAGRKKAKVAAEAPASTGTGDAPSDGEVSLEMVQGRWPAIMEKLRAQRHSTVAAFLAESSPVELNGNRLVVGFNHEFHWNQMKSAERQQIVSDLIAAETGMEMTLECRLLEPEQRGADANNDNVKNVMSMFPGSEIV
ncbi:MAG: DNA polymerase III subunit gamma/tau [Armatimonadota bacterium]|nr:MAG: DNA polymerase III subunit gamma/tau [Armatimonadota bacterium]